MSGVQPSDELLRVCDMNLSLGTNHTFCSRNAKTYRSHVKTQPCPCNAK